MIIIQIAMSGSHDLESLSTFSHDVVNSSDIESIGPLIPSGVLYLGINMKSFKRTRKGYDGKQNVKRCDW